MKNIIVIVAGASAILLSQRLAHGQITAPGVEVPLYYDPDTGNLTMDATDLPSGELYSYAIGFKGATFDPVAAGIPSFRKDEFTPFMGTVWGGGTDWTLGEIDHKDSVPAGVYSLGNVLPPNLEAGLVDLMAELTANTTEFGSVLDALGQGYGHYWDVIYGKSPFEPLNGNGSWIPAYERWAESVTLLYDMTNGKLAIDSTGEAGGALSAFGLQFHDQAPVNRENWAPMGDVSDFDENGLLSEFFTAGLPEGRYELGRLLPTGLTADDVTGFLDSSLFVGQPGHTNPFSLEVNGEPLQIRVVPEPSGLATTGCALFFLIIAGIRRSHGRISCCRRR